MARIIVVTTPEKGHVNPIVGVAQWLRRTGHTVAWLAIPHASEQIRNLGFDVLEPPPLEPGKSIVTQGAEMAELARQPEVLARWIRGLLLDAVPGQIAPLRQLLRDWRPDAVALDPMLYQAIIACHTERIPYAGISSSMNPVTPEALDTSLMRTVRALAADRRALFAAHAMNPEFRVCDCLSPYANTVFATPQYTGDIEVPAHTYVVGPSLPPEDRGDEAALPWDWRDEAKPLVFWSYGSQISWQPEQFGKVIDALGPLRVQLVISAGGLVETPWARGLPDWVRPLAYVPQRAVLEKTAVLGTHGGHNSVMEALYYGVPFVIAPQCNDQFFQAWFVERAGVGLRVDTWRADAAEIRDAVARLLDPKAPQRAAMAPITASYRANDGAREAARIVARLAS